MTIKKIFCGAFALALGIMMLGAQPSSPGGELPTDPELRTGKLDNGMTYYIRHNAGQPGMADFYIVYNVGAIQEEENEEGLAHFLEHMAFKGTKNFPNKQIINYLESVGVKFGLNLNAGTGVERTYYMMSQVPMRRESVLDTALLILHDWSHFISLEDDDIESERAVIIEEIHQRDDPAARIQRKISPVLYNGNKYGNTNIFGTEEQIRTFEPGRLRDFYKRWYRPDLQAVIVVGDIDPAAVEAKLKALMADIPAAENPQPKQSHPIPGNEEPLIAVEISPDLPGYVVNYAIKRPAQPVERNNTEEVYRFNTKLNAALKMFNNRMKEMVLEPDAPFSNAGLSNEMLSFSNDAIIGYVSPPRAGVMKALEAYLTEIERAKRYGFTEAEFERWKNVALQSAELQFDGRNNLPNHYFAQMYMNGYLQNAAMLSPEKTWELTNEIINTVTLDEMNRFFAELITDSDQVMVIAGPLVMGATPSKDKVRDLIYSVRQAEISSYEDAAAIDKPLITHDIKPGKIKEAKEGIYASTEWILDNGIRVVLKPTDFSKGQVSMTARADGGLASLDDEDYYNASMLGDMSKVSGVGDFTANELRKFLSTRMATMAPSIHRFSTSVSGTSSRKEIETMLQLAYLYFMEPRFDETDYENMLEAAVMKLRQSRNPLMDEVNKTVYGDHPRAGGLSMKALAGADLDKMSELYDDLFRNRASDYTFYFLGDFDPEAIKPLVEKYIGGLPKASGRIEVKDDGLKILPGQRTNRFQLNTGTSNSMVRYQWTGDLPYTRENDLTMKVLHSYLETVFMKSLRDDNGGAYTVYVRGITQRQPEGTYAVEVQFQTDPEMVDKLGGVLEDTLKDIAENGVDDAPFNSAVEFLLKSYPESLRKDDTWLTYLSTYYRWGEDWYTGYEDAIRAVDKGKIQALVRKIVDDGNLTKIIAEPYQR